jgi:hypothetical protein
MADESTYEGWAILELMGHRRLAGYVQEVELAGHGMIRLDVPADSDQNGETFQATQFYSPGSVYCLTPTTEEIARAASRPPAPAHRWELPRAEPREDPRLDLCSTCDHVAISHATGDEDGGPGACRIDGCACVQFDDRVLVDHHDGDAEDEDEDEDEAF